MLAQEQMVINWQCIKLAVHLRKLLTYKSSEVVDKLPIQNCLDKNQTALLSL